jgi:hypothetical protein
MANTQQYRTARVSVSAAQLRSAMFDGREHIVVPVVALKEGVIQPLQAPRPEFVPAAVLRVAPQGWNGRPVMMGHPTNGNGPVSANSPEVLEGGRAGYVFHSRMDGDALRMEAWCDVARAAAIPQLADTLKRLQAGETVDVSVGAFVETEERSGEWNGVPYEVAWTSVTPDHLAFLPAGVPGACDVTMGCGAGVAVAQKGETRMDEERKRSLRERLLSLFSFRSAEGLSDQDLRNALDKVLRATEPGYLGIEAVFPEEQKVVYAVAPGEAVALFRRSYTAAEDGSVTVGDDAEQVRPVTRFESVETEPSPAAAQKKKEGIAVGCTTHRNAEKIRALVSCPKTPWTEADIPFLESLPDERLAQFAAAMAPPQPPSEEEWLRAAPESLRRIIADYRAAQERKKQELVTQLRSAQKVYSEAQLNEMDVQRLEEIAALVNATAAATTTVVRPPAVREEGVPPPVDLTARIKSLRGAA